MAGTLIVRSFRPVAPEEDNKKKRHVKKIRRCAARDGPLFNVNTNCVIARVSLRGSRIRIDPLGANRRQRIRVRRRNNFPKTICYFAELQLIFLSRCVVLSGRIPGKDIYISGETSYLEIKPISSTLILLVPRGKTFCFLSTFPAHE